MQKILLFANTDWFLYNFRLASALAAMEKGYEVVLVSPGGRYAEMIVARGLRWVEIPLIRQQVNPFREWQTVMHLIRLYREEQPDLVHHFTIKCVLYGTFAATLTRISTIVNSLTGLGYMFTGRRVFLRLLVGLAYRILLPFTWTIFENTDDRDLFIRHGWTIPERSTVILGAGVDMERFQPTPELDGIPTVTLPARMLWDKGVGEFLQAARILRAKGVKSHFILVGDMDLGNPTAVPFNMLEDWHREGIIEWRRWSKNMPKVYSQANIVCLPSYREGLPNVLIEAAACGRALVASDVPGCRTVIQHWENGVLVPVCDAVALADALERLLKDPVLRAKMGAAGRRRALQFFSLKQITGETLAYYQHVLSLQSG
jgi:glycosyltransferase involved in cell wall biosynthesis